MGRGCLGVALALACAACGGHDPREPRAVVLLVVDTLRADRLSCYGYAAHATPSIDGLAARGVRFERAQSPASWTIPAMGAMLTSLYPTQLGLTETAAAPGERYDWRELRDQRVDTLALEERTLAEMFRDAGYRTAAFVDQPGLIAYGNFFQGFDEAYYPSGVRRIARYDPAALEYPKWPPFLRQAFGSDEELVGELTRWLGGWRRDERRFVWVHLLTPHWPYDPPARFMPQGERAGSDEDKLDPRFYDGEVRAVDELVGRVVAAIDEHVGLDRTLVVLTADHGEALGERGMHDHGHSLHAEVVHVPLILAGPGLPRGRAVPDAVSTIDILPTLADLVGPLEAPAGVRGASLLRQISDAGAPAPLYAEAMLYGATERSLARDGFKLMYDEQEASFRLFDVRADPTEHEDVAGQHPQRVESLAAELASFHGRLSADHARRAAGWSHEAHGRNQRVLQALRALGYVRD